MTGRNPKSTFLFFFFLFSFCLVPFLHAQEDSFAVIGDTRIGQTEEVYRQFIEQMGLEHIKTIIHTGDVINSSGRQNEWERFLEITGNDKTLYIAPGNHDINGKRSLEMYERIMGRPAYYSASWNDVLFVFLNTELPGQESRITGEQFEWLKGELAKEVKYKIVFLHRPVFPTAFGTSYGMDRYKVERDRFHALLVQEKVSLVVAGHEHLYDRRERDGILYVISGGGGARLLTLWPEQGGFFHYIIAKRTNEGYVFRVRDTKGNIRDQFSIKR